MVAVRRRKRRRVRRGGNSPDGRTEGRTNADAGGRSLLRWAKEAFDYIPTAKSRLVARARAALSMPKFEVDSFAAA